ncbi:hypothetical protein [Actinokineospora sp. HUAS TT18]
MAHTDTYIGRHREPDTHDPGDDTSPPDTPATPEPREDEREIDPMR